MLLKITLGMRLSKQNAKQYWSIQHVLSYMVILGAEIVSKSVSRGTSQRDVAVFFVCVKCFASNECVNCDECFCVVNL